MRAHLARAFPCDTWDEKHMNIAEAWNQAAETTDADQIGAELGTVFAIILISLELFWWIGIGLLIKTRQRRKSESK